mgnify:CR=1 FL=1
MRPAITRLSGRLVAIAGREPIPVPEGTTMETLSDFVIFDPAIEAINEVKDRWKVEGSTGNIYTVTKLGSRLHCSCPGFAFRKDCKHTKKIAAGLS